MSKHSKATIDSSGFKGTDAHLIAQQKRANKTREDLLAEFRSNLRSKTNSHIASQEKR